MRYVSNAVRSTSAMDSNSSECKCARACGFIVREERRRKVLLKFRCFFFGLRIFFTRKKILPNSYTRKEKTTASTCWCSQALATILSLVFVFVFVLVFVLVLVLFKV